MKKLLILLTMLFSLSAFADTMPFYTDSIPISAIGLYQTGDSIILYTEPEQNSKVIKKFNLSYNPNSMPDGVFALLLNEKKLGFLYVTDIGDDGWVEVIYDKHTSAKGWVQTEDRFQFLPWSSFYNMYGRKYGLRLMKNVPDTIECIHAKSDDLSQNIGVIKFAKQIKLTKISGNWALVSVLDIDNVPKTGFMRWRSNEGVIYAFPNIK